MPYKTQNQPLNKQIKKTIKIILWLTETMMRRVNFTFRNNLSSFWTTDRFAQGCYRKPMQTIWTANPSENPVDPAAMLT